MRKIIRFPWYVFFISIYPALFYWSYNLSEMNFLNGNRLVLFSFLFGMITWGLILLITRNLNTGSLITFIALLLFWSYGHLYNYLQNLYPMAFDHRLIGVLWLILFVVGVWFGKNSLSKQELAPVALNVMTAILIISPAINIIEQTVRVRARVEDKINRNIQVPITEIGAPEYSYSPDIYYIILDTYARDDILREHFSFDNSDFLFQLEDLGFYVANCSQSNYSETSLSLSSSLNYRYLDEIVTLDPTAKRFDPVIKKSSVQRILENWGYKLVAFETGHYATELTDADVYYSRTKGRLLTINEFDISFLETSFLKPLLVEPFYRADLLKAANHRARSLYVLDKLADSISIQGPKFVFAHVLIPHPPFVFGPDGEEIFIDHIQPDGKADHTIYKDGYIKQTIYANKRVLEIVTKILDESSQEPIIILQGDHGPNMGKRIKPYILNAYYIPGHSQGLYETISPVNTFRYIFNAYFGQNLIMYEDIARFSSLAAPQKYEIIPNQCNRLCYLPLVTKNY